MAADTARLAEARLYFVTDAGTSEPALREALAGGVDVLQLRQKDVDAACERLAQRGLGRVRIGDEVEARLGESRRVARHARNLDD